MVAREAPYLPLPPALLSGDRVAFRETLVSALRAHAKYGAHRVAGTTSAGGRGGDRRPCAVWPPTRVSESTC
jgi:hypothetical protein